MRHAGSASGAWIYDTDDGKTVFSYKAGIKRTLASNEKLLTSISALDHWGPDHRTETILYGVGQKNGSTWDGDLYLRGNGDPLLSTDTFAKRRLGSLATRVSKLAKTLASTGVAEVTGRVYGDESYFDSRRGVPSSNYATSFYVGPLSGLALNTGHSDLAGRYFQASPASFAADRFTSVLAEQGIDVNKRPAGGHTPTDGQMLAAVDSKPLTTIAKVMNKASNNYFAEMLNKGLGADFGSGGTTAAGASVIEDFAYSQGVTVNASDGSGLSRANKASPQALGLLLAKAKTQPYFSSLKSSLPIAGRDGTLRKRMRATAASGRVHAKTGTINGVSTLSGYIDSASGKHYVFSLLMSNIGVYTAHTVQDRIAILLAAS